MSKKIIIAEDSSVIQNLTKRILSQLQYEIVSVKNGQQVLDLLAKDQYNIVLLDIHMPIMDGMDCAKRIRSTGGENQNIPIIAITGNANNYTEMEFEAAGINAFIPKPLNYDSLVEKVKELIK